MNKVDPIIAVNDVPASAAWYQEVFGCTGMHGGEHFEILLDRKGEVLICLHQWGTHEHPTMIEPVQPGNGLILYLRTDQMETIHKLLDAMKEKFPEIPSLNFTVNIKLNDTIYDGLGIWVLSLHHWLCL